jgi:deazaflavin-dependent oxidoreductase (nitroreductase family)
MPFPPAVARFNKHVTNRILGPIVRFLPGFGTIVHRGRTSGRTYRTPIMAFRSPDGRRLVFALTYGSHTEWLKNVLASGEAGFDSRWSGVLRLTEPRFVHDPQRRAVPWPIRQILRLMRVDEFLETTIAM